MENTEFKELQKLEAVARMKILKMHENAIKDFWHGVLNCSEYGGILYWLDEEKRKLVERFEQRTGGMVYHLIESVTTIGTMLTMLYVSKNESEWESDREEMTADGYVVAYVENVTYPDCSELGWVVVKPQFGGVVRVA